MFANKFMKGMDFYLKHIPVNRVGTFFRQLYGNDSCLPVNFYQRN